MKLKSTIDRTRMWIRLLWAAASVISIFHSAAYAQASECSVWKPGSPALRIEKWQALAAACEQAVALQPDNPQINETLGHAYEALGRNEDAAARLQAAANAGSPSAMTALALKYENGTGVPKDIQTAVRWLESASAKNDAAGMTALGFIYQGGSGIEAQPKRAFDLYTRASNQGYVFAESQLAYCYYAGIGTEKNPEQLFVWGMKAVDQGYGPAAIYLGAYMEEVGKLGQALMWYRKAFSLGDTDVKDKVTQLEAQTERQRKASVPPEAGQTVYAKPYAYVAGAIICDDIDVVGIAIESYGHYQYYQTMGGKAPKEWATPPALDQYGCSFVPAGTQMTLLEPNPPKVRVKLNSGKTRLGVTFSPMVSTLPPQ